MAAAMPHPKPILIAGPTASGKSALAVVAARRSDGVVINADSMQVYADLRVLTARPSPEEAGLCPHRLYGHVPAAEAFSVARWLHDVKAVLDECDRDGRRPVIVGGTGLYFKALLEGLSPIPAIPDEIRQHWRREAARLGAVALHAELARRDPGMAQRLKANDAQRITRALEVLAATGRSLADWQQVKGTPLIDPGHAIRIVLRPPRGELQLRADHRFDLMMAAGALDEVARLRQLHLDPALPAMGAIGVRPLLQHLEGKFDRDDAIAQGKLETRQYIKRQENWASRHMSSFIAVQTVLNCENTEQYMHLIDD